MAESESGGSKIPEEVKKSVRAVLLSKIGGVPLERFSVDYKNLAGSPLHFRKMGFSSLRDFLESMPDVVRFNYSEEASKWMLYGIGDANSYMSSFAKKAQYSKPGDGKEKEKRNRNKKKFNNSKGNQGESRPPSRQMNTSEDGRQAKNNTPSSKRDYTAPRRENGGGRNASSKKEKGSTKEDASRKEGGDASSKRDEAARKREDASSRLEGEETDGELRVPRSNRGFYTVCVHYKGNLGDSNIYKIMQEVCELFATQGDVIEKASVKSLMFFRFLTEDEAISVIKLYNGRKLADGSAIRVRPASEKMPARKDKGGPSDRKLTREQQKEEQHHLRVMLEQTHQKIAEHHQMLQEMCEPWPPEAYDYMPMPPPGAQGEPYLMHDPHHHHHPHHHQHQHHPMYAEQYPYPMSGAHHMPSMHGDAGEPYHNGYQEYDESSMVELGVFHLDQTITQEDLMYSFWRFNPLRVRLRSKLGDRNNRRYFAFVAFSCLADAHNAQQQLNNTMLKDCRISIEQAKTKQYSLRQSDMQDLPTPKKEGKSRKLQKDCSDSREPAPRSGDESNDSITAELVTSESPVPISDGSHNSIKTNPTEDALSSLGSEVSSGASEASAAFGLGRGSLLGHVSPPPVGRGLAMLNAGMQQKKLRPSLADLTDRLHEL